MLRLLLFFPLFIAVVACASDRTGPVQPSMTGQWVAVNRNFELRLDLRESANGEFAGTGGLGCTRIGCDATGPAAGTHAHPAVTFTLTGVSTFPLEFAGKFLDDRQIEGALAGLAAHVIFITLEKQ